MAPTPVFLPGESLYRGPWVAQSQTQLKQLSTALRRRDTLWWMSSAFPILYSFLLPLLTAP